MTVSTRASAARPLLVDAAIAAGLTLLSIIAVVGGASDAGARNPVSIGLLLLQTVPLVLRRVAPVPVLVVTFAATIVHAIGAFGMDDLNESWGSLVALYTVAEQKERRVSVAAALVVGGVFAALLLAKGVLPQGLQGFIQTQLSIGVGWALGYFSRTRTLVARLLAERERMIEAEREERAGRAVQAERERIARELHDVVTHHVSVVVIQAGAAQRALDRRPEQVRQALDAIERSGRQALTDMRRMLGILGESGPDATALNGSATGSDGLAPMPGLDRLGELFERVREAGLPVEVSVRGDRRPLDAGIELSAYRIVQEALTNTLKYARGARARVDIRYELAALEIEVVDHGGSPADPLEPHHEGHGLIGMRERVAVFGGDLECGRTPTGFRVAARLPFERAPAGTTA